MASRLKSVITVTALAPAASVTVPHHLNVSGYPRAPDRIDRGVLGTLEFSDSNTLTVTITNTGAEAVTGRVLLEVWHSTQRALGGPAALAGGPFVTGGGTGEGAGGAASSFTTTPMTLTGNEDAVLTGNIFDNVVTATGTLAVVQYVVPGVGNDPGAVYAANATAILGGRGTFTLTAGGVPTFEPVADYHGSFGPIACWVTNGSELRTLPLTIVITAVNDGPTANAAYQLSFSGEAVSIDLLQFATDPDDDPLTVTHLNGTAVAVGVPVVVTGGTYVYQGAGVVEVTPDNAEVAPITFTYTVSDGTLSDAGTVTVQVGVANLPLFSPFAPILGTAIDQAMVNFGKTVRFRYGPGDDNGVNVAAPPYSPGQGLADLNNREPWLYDRATCVWLLAKRTGDAAILAEAMTLAERYMAGVVVSGAGLGTFNIIGNTGGDPTDVKYLYAPVAWWYEYERLAAGATVEEAQVYRSRAQGLYRQTLVSFGMYDANTAELWTERNSWAAIMNCLAWYWISGSTAALADATNYVENVLSLSGSGAPLHSKDKHESDGDPTQIVSPWMAALLAEALLQYHRTTDDARIVTWLANLGDWLLAHAFYTATGAEEPELIGLAGLRLPAYLAGGAVQFPEGEAADMRHCIDVAGLIRKCRWAKVELSQSTAALDTLIDELEEAATVDIAYWTRFTEGYPKYRVNPSRSWAWMYRAYYSAVYSVGIVPFPPALTTAPVVTGSTQQGSTLTSSTGVWAGTPVPTYTYQWQRDGVAIGGATNATYVTVGADIGTGVRCRVTATNAGGTASANSNAITVVVAGSPEITVQPNSTSALEGATAVFSLTATGTPAPTYQWQVNPIGGGGWANVAEGAGGTTNSYTTEALASNDNGDQYRCIVTNAGGSVTSSIVTLTLVVAQPAVAFTDSTDFGALTYTMGSAGFVGITLAGWFRYGNVINSASWFGAEGAADRHVDVGFTNSGALSISDSQTGPAGGGWDVDPPINTWFFLVLSFPSVHPGTYVARWYDESGVYGGTADKSNGVEDSLTVNVIHLNGGGAANTNIGCQLRAQHVRGYARVFDATAADAEFANTNLADADLRFFCVFEDDGGGGVTCRDATGNNRVFTLTGAALSLAGPVAPSV